jgi:hypothetical protein
LLRGDVAGRTLRELYRLAQPFKFEVEDPASQGQGSKFEEEQRELPQQRQRRKPQSFTFADPNAETAATAGGSKGTGRGARQGATSAEGDDDDDDQEMAEEEDRVSKGAGGEPDSTGTREMPKGDEVMAPAKPIVCPFKDCAKQYIVRSGLG